MNALAAAHISSGMKLTRPVDCTAPKLTKLGHRRYASEPPPRTALSDFLLERELPSGYKPEELEEQSRKMAAEETATEVEVPEALEALEHGRPDSAASNLSTLAVKAETQPVMAHEVMTKHLIVTHKGKQRDRPRHSRASSDGSSFLAAFAQRLSGIRSLS